MGVKLPNGSTVSIASDYGVPIAVTAISNASPPIVSAVDHGLVAGDIVEVTSGWSDLSGRAARVIVVTEDTFSLEGLDTTDTGRFIPGSGVGSVRQVNTFQQITQILETANSGGEQQFYTYSFLEDTGDDRQIPTTRSPSSMTLTVADDPALPQTQVLEQASLDKIPRVVQFKLASGALIYFGAYVSVTDMPTTTKNQAMANTVTLSKTGRATRYAGAQA